MRITQVRDDGKVNTMRTLKIEQLVEQMKKETKAQLVSNMREVLPYILPGDKNDYIERVPKILPAAAFVRKNGVMAMAEYNGIVMLQVNGLSGRMEADEVKECVKELPQTYLAFIGSSGKSVKIWVRFTYPDNRLPDNREQAEVFHAHAYRLAVKYYQPQLPFDIELRVPSLEQYCRLTFDPELYFNPEAMPVYLKQPASLPGKPPIESRYRRRLLLYSGLFPDMIVTKHFLFFLKQHLPEHLPSKKDTAQAMIYTHCLFVWLSSVFVPAFHKKIPCDGHVLIIVCRKMNS